MLKVCELFADAAVWTCVVFENLSAIECVDTMNIVFIPVFRAFDSCRMKGTQPFEILLNVFIYYIHITASKVHKNSSTSYTTSKVHYD